MDIKQNIDYWLKSAAHDMGVAETLFQNNKNDWCLFICHLVLEKTLKAFYVRDNNDNPPLIHNLVRLEEKTKLNCTESQLQFLADVNRFNIESRYPDIKFQFQKLCTTEFTKEQFSKIKEMYQWLLSQAK
ncbi:MAG: HEPN domain-containing protein [Candidatus Scalindua sp.]